MRVLAACEYSGIVRDAFLRRGHDAMSGRQQTNVDSSQARESEMSEERNSKQTIYGELTAEETRWIQEISVDKWTAKKALEVAIDHYQNSMNEARKEEEKFWDHMGERLGIDPSDGWKLRRHNKRSVVVPATDEDRRRESVA